MSGKGTVPESIENMVKFSVAGNLPDLDLESPVLIKCINCQRRCSVLMFLSLSGWEGKNWRREGIKNLLGRDGTHNVYIV